MDKRLEFVKNFYDNYEEDNRLKFQHNFLEYQTTLNYITKYAKKGCKILEIGAGTGAYSVALAKNGYNVTSVELVESNLKVLKQNAKGIENIQCFQGDAINLSQFKDNSFDVVLSLGPMYHLFAKKDINKAISEAIRVCKKGGIIMLAYISSASVVWNSGVVKGHFKQLEPLIKSNGSLKRVPNEVFSTYFVDEFKALFDNRTKFIKNVATDSISGMVRESINKFSKDELNILLKWHLKTCENKDMLGLSCHLLYICQKV